MPWELISIPVITPDNEPIDATLTLLLLHVPPGDPSLRVVVRPAHTVVLPAITVGNGFTVTFVVLVQPVANV